MLHPEKPIGTPGMNFQGRKLGASSIKKNFVFHFARNIFCKVKHKALYLL
jgi:hypothetical protein